jgi:hypothetical protein
LDLFLGEGRIILFCEARPKSISTEPVGLTSIVLLPKIQKTWIYVIFGNKSFLAAFFLPSIASVFFLK